MNSDKGMAETVAAEMPSLAVIANCRCRGRLDRAGVAMHFALDPRAAFASRAVVAMPPHTDQAGWFAEEVQPHESALRGYLRGSFPAVRDMDDVVQESYLRVWRACVGQPIRSGRSFLFQVARRIAIDFVRRERVSPLVPVSEAMVAAAIAPGADSAEAAARADDLDWLARAFEAMPPRRREVMLLRKIEGVPQREIAARLGITEAAVQIHVVRGLRDLEEFFDGCDARRPAP